MDVKEILEIAETISRILVKVLGAVLILAKILKRKKKEKKKPDTRNSRRRRR